MRALDSVVPDLKIALATHRHAGHPGRLGSAVEHEIGIFKGELRALCRDHDRNMGDRDRTARIGARQIKGKHSGLRGGARERQTIRAPGQFEPRGDLIVVPRVPIRTLSARGARDLCTIFGVRRGRRQQAALKHQGIPRHDGNHGTIGFRLRLGAQVALGNAAEILTCLLVLEFLERKRVCRLPSERLRNTVLHAEPLIRELHISRRTR